MIAIGKPEPERRWWHTLGLMLQLVKFRFGMAIIVAVLIKVVASFVFSALSKSFTFSPEVIALHLGLVLVGCGLMVSGYYEVSRREKDAASVPQNAASTSPTERS